MTLTKASVAEIARGVYCINEFGMDSMFLITGAEKALLIDTGTGTFDLPAFIRELTDLPVEVALTHGHVDHAGGIGWFDRVYLHPADFESAKSVSADSRRGYANLMSKVANGLYEIPDVIEFDKLPELLPITEGYVFDLGNRNVRVYETPGHTPGGVSFLIEDARVLISGDACNPNTLLFTASVESLLKCARRIDEISPLYDRNYNGHIGFGSDTSFMPMNPRLTRDMIALCEGVIDGSVKYEITAGFFGRIVAIAACDTCRIQFDEKKIREA